MLLLTVHTLCVENKPLLSVLSIGSSSGSEEGSGQGWLGCTSMTGPHFDAEMGVALVFFNNREYACLY